MNTYHQSTVVFFLKDKENSVLYDLGYHLDHDDYFGVLGVIIGSIRDDYDTKTDPRSQEVTSLLSKMQRDLAYLHKTHTIKPKGQ